MHLFNSPCPLCSLTAREFGTCASRTLRLMALASVTTVTMAVALPRSPVTPIDLHDIQLNRELLAGSDALLERMVIPPNRPDWVLLSCSEHEGKASENMSMYDDVRHALCEAARKASASHISSL